MNEYIVGIYKKKLIPITNLPLYGNMKCETLQKAIELYLLYFDDLVDSEEYIIKLYKTDGSDLLLKEFSEEEIKELALFI